MVKRRRFSKAQKEFIIARQHGRCDETGCEFVEGDQIEFDHRIPLALGGEDTLDNLRAVLSSAHLIKTRVDVWRISKMKRQRGEHGQQARRARRKAEGKAPLLVGRGFSKTLKKRFNGEVVSNVPKLRRDQRRADRETGAAQ